MKPSAGTLKCFQRDGMTKLPGCDRGDAGDKKECDICYDPSETESTQRCRVLHARVIAILLLFVQ